MIIAQIPLASTVADAGGLCHWCRTGTIEAMPNLIDKLNVLVQSRLPRRPSRRDRRPSLGRKADRELARLRKQVEEALADDDRAEAELAALDREIRGWDAQADAALAAGQEAAARHAIRQMKLAEQRRTIAAAELDARRRATAELIRQVNVYEAALAQARQRPGESFAPGAEPEQPVSFSSDRAVPDATPPAPLDERAVDDDLARRRARLSQ